MIELNRTTGKALRYGIITGLAIVLVGLIASVFSGDVSEKILWVGIGVIIFVPFVSIIISALALYSEKDWYWFRHVLLLIAILIVGLILSIMR